MFGIFASQFYCVTFDLRLYMKVIYTKCHIFRTESVQIIKKDMNKIISQICRLIHPLIKT